MLTSDAKTMLYKFYTEYKTRRQNGVHKSQAKNFSNIEFVQENICPEWLLEDIVETIRELDHSGFLNVLYSNNIPYRCLLTDYAIVLMENQKKETLLSIADFISKFIP